MSPAVTESALKLLKKDKKLGPVIKRMGVLDMGRPGETYEALCRAIVYQQLSGKAAGTIYGRFCALFPKKTPTAKLLLKKSREELRSVGLSNQKTNYLIDLSEKFDSGFITPKKFPMMSDEEIREHLVAVKGIGVWTADMFLMFNLGRPDVLPVGDLGIQKGFKKLFNLRALPDATKMIKLARAWQPYRTVACEYLWKIADEGNANRPSK